MDDNQSTKLGSEYKNILIVSGIISLIGLLIPSGINYKTLGSASLLEFFWMAGIFGYTASSSIGSSSEIMFFSDEKLLFPGWIALILILIGSALIISTAIKIKKEEINPVKTKIRTSIALVLFFCGSVYYLVGMESAWAIVFSNRFWGDIAVPFFGVFAPILSGIIAIYCLAKIGKNK